MIVVAFLLIIIAVFGFAGGENKCKDPASCNYLKRWCTMKSVIEKCPGKCGSCGGKKKCKDVGTSCNYWREKGWCFMKLVIEKCPRTCGLCAQIGLNIPVFTNNGENECADLRDECSAMKDSCNINEEIKKSCPKTCGLCGGENKCKDPASCNYLKGKRWCKMKSVIEKCPGKCGSCAKAADIKWHENKDDANEKKLMPSRMIPRGGYRDIGIFRGKNGRFHQPSRDYRGGYDLGYAHNAHYSK